MRWALFTSVSLLCLLACLVAATWWAWSYRYEPSLSYYWPDGVWEVSAGEGNIGLWYNTYLDPHFNDDKHNGYLSILGQHRFKATVNPEPWDRWHLLRNGIGIAVQGPRVEAKGGFIVVLPCWVVCAILLALPARWFVVLRRRRLLACSGRRKLCARCGYDLRASKDRCPECGQPIRCDSAQEVPRADRA